MKRPNLSRIIEAYIPVNDPTNYIAQLRSDVLPSIRELQSFGHLRWFSFLFHPAKQFSSCDLKDDELIIHIRFEPSPDLSQNKFNELLPEHFCKPQPANIEKISGLEQVLLHESNWAEAWRLVGESAEWVLELLETHPDKLSPQQIIQFLHFITNSIGIGNKCIYTPYHQFF